MAPVEPIDWKGRLGELGLARRRKRRVSPPPAARVSTTAAGRAGEEAAARFLEVQGVKIVGRNVRAQGSEIDLVGIDGSTLVFIEVKRRRNGRLGAPAEAVTTRKRRRIVSGARRWLAGSPAHGRGEVRFDVVTIEDETSSIAWIQGAFDATFS